MFAQLLLGCLIYQVYAGDPPKLPDKLITIDPASFERTNDFIETKSKFRMAAKDESLRWKDATIVYQLAVFAFDEREVKEMKAAMRVYEQETCLKFRPAKRSDPYGAIIRMGSGGCNAILGQYVKQGYQTVNLGYGCRFPGLYYHELGHTIGLHHEHQHPDRDRGVKILSENVNPDWRIWFDLIDRKELNMYGVDYDIQSIMHYGWNAFGKEDKSLTIKALNPAQQKYLLPTYMKDLSFGDIKRINLMYKCNARCGNVNCPSSGFVDKNCKCVTPQDFAQRRCVDVSPTSECEKSKSTCDSEDGWTKYEMLQKCRKTCKACYEAI